MDLKDELFLRRVLHGNQVEKGVVRARAFKPHDDGISVSRNLPVITSEDEVTRFLQWSSRNKESLLGVCVVTRSQVEGIKLTIQHDYFEEDDEDQSKVYADLHHLIQDHSIVPDEAEDMPKSFAPNADHLEQLARFATKNAYIRFPEGK